MTDTQINEQTPQAVPSLKAYFSQGNFWLIFAIIMFEGIVYYGLRSFLVLYLTDDAQYGGLGLSEEDGLNVYASFTTAVYIAMFCGGVLGDITKKYQHIIAISLVAMLVSLAWLSQSQADNYFLPLIIIGCASGAVQVCLFAKLGQVVKSTPIFALNTFAGIEVASNLSTLFAPLMVGLTSESYSYQHAFYLCVALTLLPLVLSLIYLKKTGNAQSKQPSRASLKPNNSLLKISLCIIAVLILDNSYWLIQDAISSQQYELIATTPNQMLLSLIPAFAYLILIILGLFAFHRICKASMVNFAIIYPLVTISGYIMIQANSANQPTQLLMLFGVLMAVAEILLITTAVSLLCQYTNTKYLGSIMGLSFFISMFTQKAMGMISEIENILTIATYASAAIAMIIVIALLINKKLSSSSETTATP